MLFIYKIKIPSSTKTVFGTCFWSRFYDKSKSFNRFEFHYIIKKSCSLREPKTFPLLYGVSSFSYDDGGTYRLLRNRRLSRYCLFLVLGRGTGFCPVLCRSTRCSRPISTADSLQTQKTGIVTSLNNFSNYAKNPIS